MKNLILIQTGIFLTLIVFAQSPQSFQYQAVARDAQGNVLAGRYLTFKASILKGSPAVPAMYVETHNQGSDPFGLVNLSIGNGTVVSGNFENIAWGSDLFFLQLEMDPQGGSNWFTMGAMQLQSVPYALYADRSGGDRDWNVNGQEMFSATSGFVGIGTENPLQRMTVVGHIRSAFDHTEADFLEIYHGPNNGVVNFGGIGHLDFRYEENTLGRLLQDGRMALGSDTWCAGSSLLQLNSATQGFRPPRMNSDKIAALENPKDGLMVFNTIDEHLYIYREYHGSKWHRVGYDINTINDCPETFIDVRDGTEYSATLIGDQCWMAENLNIGDKIDLNITTPSNNGIIEKYCYDDDEYNCDVFGGLYCQEEASQYSTVPGSQGACPDGWHIPTDEEWKQLEGAVDSQFGYPDPEWDLAGWRGYDAGLNKKSTTGWNSGGNGTDLFGFNALPGGAIIQMPPDHSAKTPSHDKDGMINAWYSGLGGGASFWQDPEFHRSLSFEYNDVYRSDYEYHIGSSVRCLKD